jgi:hypothetical protein
VGGHFAAGGWGVGLVGHVRCGRDGICWCWM